MSQGEAQAGNRAGVASNDANAMQNLADVAGVAGKAKLLVLVLALAWGLNWIAAAFALPELSPWSLRFMGCGLGAVTLSSAALLSGHSLKVPRGEAKHIAVAGFCNVALFQVLSAFAQTSGATSRAIIITYSMPIWATLLSWLMLGEKLDRLRGIAFVICVVGLGILVWPLFANGFPPTVYLSLTCALGWAYATVHMKWAKTTVEPLANAAWQLVFGFFFIAAGTFIFESAPHVWPLRNETILAVLYVGIFGVGLAHFLWWAIVAKLPTTTASIGALLVPVIGVTASTVFLHERPSIPDMVGFILIFIAAACVLLQPNSRRPEPRA